MAAADDHRLVGERRIVALFNGRVKSVAIDVGDRHASEFAVAGDARRTAAGAARSALRHIGKTVAAKARPKTRPKTRHRVRPRNRKRIIGGSSLIWPAAGAVEDAQDVDGVADDAVRQDVRRAGYDKLARFCDSPRTSGVRKSGKLALSAVHDACHHGIGSTVTVLRDIGAERAKVRQRRTGPQKPHLARGRGSLRLAPAAHARTSSWGTRSPRSAAAMPSLMAAICHSCTARNSSIASAAKKDLLRRTRKATDSRRRLTCGARRTVSVVLSVMSCLCGCVILYTR